MPPRRGDDGYRDWCLAEMEAGRCTCPHCSGQLVDEVCAACGCRHFVQVQGHARYASWIPAYDRCPDAQRSLAEWKRQQEQDHRKRRRAEALSDDPQR
jgi:hypothetical protein